MSSPQVWHLSKSSRVATGVHFNMTQVSDFVVEFNCNSLLIGILVVDLLCYNGIKINCNSLLVGLLIVDLL